MSQVKVWQEMVDIPTYEAGAQDIHPMFLEHRVYQGSSGAVYPYGVTDVLSDEKVMKSYRALWLENDYLKVMLLPELGGRVHKAWDKVKQRDFVYHNDVIKPALVGLLGPWISGGIEFNWPQHHRPTTFMPVDYFIQEQEDGSKTVWMGEMEPMRGLQVMTGFTLHPNRALLEIVSKVYNGNPTPRHFLWWANPAVKGGDGHQSVFPPDVTAVFDHGKRAVSSFPIATGTYYKVDYSAGVDISRYKNVPVPTSYMAEKSDYDFVGAYCHDEGGGLLHVADHHYSPGKKQWSWGYSEFGQAWDRNLTDENGPYIELMTGVFTDNQPDFTWLDAWEEKQFVQNFLPYNSLGTIQNASCDALLKLEREKEQIVWGVYAVAPLVNYRLVITSDKHSSPLLDTAITLQPGEVQRDVLPTNSDGRLTITLFDAQSKAILSYTEHQPQETPLPEVAKAPLPAVEITSTDETWFIGQHLEQYNHASRSPFDYYLRGVELDPLDYRNNLALATLEYNRANDSQAIEYASQALKRAHKLNKNPACGLASLVRANAYERQGKLESAREDYYRATWSGNGKSGGYLGLARLATRDVDYQQALSFCHQSLLSNAANQTVICLKGLVLQLAGQRQESQQWLTRWCAEYPLNPTLHYLLWRQYGDDAHLEQWRQVSGGRGINSLLTAGLMLSCGQPELAQEVLSLLNSQETLPLYFRASMLPVAERVSLLADARAAFPAYVRFPNTLDEVDMLESLTECYFARHLLACFHYSKRNYQRAVELWRECTAMQPDFADAWRGLGIYAWNKQRDGKRAEEYLERAFSLAPQDARLLFERDLLDKLRAMDPQMRLNRLEQHFTVALQRDDLTAEMLGLYNQLGKYSQAAKILQQRKFHPWEGGEGKVTGQYISNLLLNAFQHLVQQQPAQAVELLQQALHYPENLSEGRLSGQTDNDIWFWMGVGAQQQGQSALARNCFIKASAGDRVINVHRYYNDQPVDYLFYQGVALHCLGDNQGASTMFSSMADWADEMAKQTVGRDFFAVSQPDLLALDSDLQQQHQENCLFIRALAYLGQSDLPAFEQQIERLLSLNPAHSRAHQFSVLSGMLAEFAGCVPQATHPEESQLIRT
ncbi:DUF5107 domain-containing protein [Limnobaculum zhutongyuii]|uniref:DUF5107 domain-containing protein n=1 Tax=Limnobaculum zhutongyuii TaxID=2498113 RepID=A0A411WNN3_9GAMM|nr:DUF5107 domain-containing protein [Limnobaculum zhutongyuii]QBH97665.1 DUF5107 domain-containing protein [Limnobaculum zhutongyuii]TQS86768.1 DUF5107 domain-containing protein [Limnobaculum zhutongyuii]